MLRLLFFFFVCVGVVLKVLGEFLLRRIVSCSGGVLSDGSM